MVFAAWAVEDEQDGLVDAGVDEVAVAGEFGEDGVEFLGAGVVFEEEPRTVQTRLEEMGFKR